MESIMTRAEIAIISGIGSTSDKGFAQYKKWRGRIHRAIRDMDETKTEQPTVWQTLKKGKQHGI